MVVPRGEITVTLGGKVRTMRMCNKAIATTEGLLGKPWFKIDFTELGVRDFAAIAYAGLSIYDRKLTLDDVYEWMDNGEQAAVGKAAVEAIKALSQEGAEEKKESPAQ